MASIHEVVQALAKREGVDAVVVVSADGLPIDQAGKNGLDSDAVAALTASVAQSARRLGQAVEAQKLTVGVLEFDSRLVVFTDVGTGNLLFVLLAPSTNIGGLLYDLRRHAPSIADLL